MSGASSSHRGPPAGPRKRAEPERFSLAADDPGSEATTTVLQVRWPDIPVGDGTDRPHVVYRLGPPLRIEPLPTGRNFWSQRVSVLLDQLLSCDMLVDALAGTAALLQGEPSEG
jgi:hypothetical protein